jgi:hypothetical protein
MSVARSLYVVAVVLGLLTNAGASQPPIVPDDACRRAAPSETILEARIISIEQQPRYTCSPYQGTTQGWIETLTRRNSRHVPLHPTATAGCILASAWITLDDRARDQFPLDRDGTPTQIELRVDGLPRTVPYDRMWAVCGLAPGHHAIEMDTALGPLTCEGEVRANETLTLEARYYGAIVHIEPTRLVAGPPRVGQRFTVEYHDVHRRPAHYDGFPETAILRIATSSDGVLHATPCREYPATPPKAAPRNAPRTGCAHCSAATSEPMASTFVALVVLALVIIKRRT